MPKDILSEGASLQIRCPQYEIPVILISGGRDWTTPGVLAKEFFGQISAPRKCFLPIGDAGHLPFPDRPKEFSEQLCDVLKSL